MKFENCLLEECNFAGANLTDGFFVLTKFADECILNGVKFNNAMINQTDFLEANLSGASFREAKVDQSSFETCNMTGAEFIDAVVKKTSFNGATMRGVSFENAVVEGADFTGTDLSTCNLNGRGHEEPRRFSPGGAQGVRHREQGNPDHRRRNRRHPGRGGGVRHRH